MARWLFKSEPDAFSWDDLVAKGKAGEEWNGVRSLQARNIMREMKVGDRGFFYHSNIGKEVVGIVEVIATAHPDSTADDPKWECVDLKAVEPLPAPWERPEIGPIEILPAPLPFDPIRIGEGELHQDVDGEWLR